MVDSRLFTFSRCDQIREACRSRCSCDPLSLPNLDRLSGFCAESRHACDTASQDWMPSLLFKWEVGVNCDDEFSSSLFFILQKMITLRMRMLVRMWPGCWNTLCCCEEACKNDGGKGLRARGKLLREERERGKRERGERVTATPRSATRWKMRCLMCARSGWRGARRLWTVVRY